MCAVFAVAFCVDPLGEEIHMLFMYIQAPLPLLCRTTTVRARLGGRLLVIHFEVCLLKV